MSVVVDQVSAVRTGTIGIAGSGGLGGREVAVRIHDFGGGLSRAIWTAPAVPGDAGDAAAIADALRALDADPGTEVVVLAIRRPTAPVEETIATELERCTKPVVVCFIDGRPGAAIGARATVAETTKEAALQALLLTGVQQDDLDLHPLNWPLIHEVRAKLGPEQRFIRALFCGSDLCAEAVRLTMQTHRDVHVLEPAQASVAHTFVDFAGAASGDRAARLVSEAGDPEVAVVTLDFILGDGAQDPVGELLPAIVEARRRAADDGRHLEVLAYVHGTDLDAPSVIDQVRALEGAGVTIASSNANAGLLSREFVSDGPTEVTMPDREPVDTWFAAVADGDRTTAEALLADGIDIDVTNARRRTAILVAAMNRRYELVEMLAAAGADIDKQDETNFNPFTYGCITNDLRLVRLMVRAGADIDRLTRFGGVGLHPAAEKGYVELVRELLTTTDVNVNLTNWVGWTPLLEAIVLNDGGPGQQEIVRLLLEHGANPHLTDKYGKAPRELAEELGYTEIVELLAAAGA